MRFCLPGILVALTGVAMCALPSAATAATEGYVSVRTPYEVTAGTKVAVRARVREWIDEGRERRCTLKLRGPGKSSLLVPAKRVAGSARIGWKVRIPVLARPGHWKVRLACPGLGTSGDSFTVHPGTAAARIAGAQVVPLSGHTDYYAWAVRITNPFRDRELRSMDVEARLRDAAGRVVGTASLSQAATLPAGRSAWIGYRSTVGGEVPVAVSVRARGEVHRRRARELETNDLRLVRVPPAYDGDSTDLVVRAEVGNGNGFAVSSEYVFVSVFDAAGRLVNASYDLYPGTLEPGSTGVVDLDLGKTGAESAATVQLFWPPQPR